MDCIFCKIINEKKESKIIFENDKIIVIKDINPEAKTHLLIIPKKHIESVKEIKEGDKELMGEMFLVAKKVAEEKELNHYQLHINVGRGAGQMVDHIHMHLKSNN